MYKIVIAGLFATFVAAASALAQSADESQLAPPRCEYGAPHPDAPNEIQQFAFLVGDFTITSHAWQNSAWTPPRPGPRARWNGWYGLGGMSIVDEWYDPDPGIDPTSGRGVNVRMYDADEGEWHMMWISTVGKQVQDLRANVEDGVLTMWQVYPERANFRATFHVEDDDHWYRISYVKDEQGEWTPQFKLAATRIPSQLSRC